MSYEPNAMEVAAITGLAAQKRYEYFVKRVTDWQELWGLWRDEGWVLAGDPEGNQALAVWPARVYAELLAPEIAEGSVPRCIPLDTWFNNVEARLATEHKLVAVFPVSRLPCITVRSGQLRRDLEAELEKY